MIVANQDAIFRECLRFCSPWIPWRNACLSEVHQTSYPWHHRAYGECIFETWNEYLPDKTNSHALPHITFYLQLHANEVLGSEPKYVLQVWMKLILIFISSVDSLPHKNIMVTYALIFLESNSPVVKTSTTSTVFTHLLSKGKNNTKECSA